MSDLLDIQSIGALQAVYRDLSKEVNVVQLCARGARYATIRSLFEGDVVISRIREITREFNGDQKASKARSVSLYTESKTNRLHSSVLVAFYRSYLKSDLNDIDIYLRVYREYLDQFLPSDVVYDIDELIRLIRSMALGLIRIERCEHCGSNAVVAQSEVSISDNCPHCGTESLVNNRQHRRKNDVRIPDEAKIERYIGSLERSRTLAIELVLVGARPQEVEALIPGQGEYARGLWPRLLGRRAPQGAHAFNQLYYIETIERRRHASYLVNKYLSLKKAGMTGAVLLLALYRDYLQIYADAVDPMRFSQVRFVVQLAATGELKLSGCKSCHGKYVILKNEIPGDQKCPICRMIAIQDREQKAYRKSGTQIRIREDGMIVCPLPGDTKRRMAENKSERTA